MYQSNIRDLLEHLSTINDNYINNGTNYYDRTPFLHVFLTLSLFFSRLCSKHFIGLQIPSRLDTPVSSVEDP